LARPGGRQPILIFSGKSSAWGAFYGEGAIL